MNWRKNIDPLIRSHLEFQIKEASKNKNAYSKSKNPSNAQLWCAIANLSKQVFDLNLKIKFLENTLKEVASQNTKKKSSSKKKTKKAKKKSSSLKKSLKKY